MKSDIEQNFSEEYILSRYNAGDIPLMLVLHFCSVCEELGPTELEHFLSYKDFLSDYASGSIQKNKSGNLARVTTTIYTCPRCTRELKELND